MPRRTSTIRHTLHEWLRLIGWAVSHTEPRIGYPQARITTFPDPTSSPGDAANAPGPTAEVPASAGQHVR